MQVGAHEVRGTAGAGRADISPQRTMIARLPRLRVHVYARELLTIPASSPDWPEVKAALVRCAQLRRALVNAARFN